MMNEIRCRNPTAAENALRTYFDSAAIRVNDLNLIGTALTITDSRPLRYSPVLHARLSRIFRNK